jgi:exopolysaccharide production protein ExoY
MSFEVQFRANAPALPVAPGSNSRGPLLEATSLETANALHSEVSRHATSSREAGAPNRTRHVLVGGRSKRAVDMILSLLLLAVLSPIMLMVATLVRLRLQENPISRQEQIGANGRRFTGLKFRTMPSNADEILRRYLLSDANAAREWRDTHSLRSDPRLGCLGRILTRSGLDEMPQLFNVLRGEMSIVGPRPAADTEWLLQGACGAEWPQARPGITGLWRVGSPNSAPSASRLAQDLYYVRNWSFRLDCWILLKTIPALLDLDGTP